MNKFIKINNKTLFNFRSYEMGIKIINDLLDDNGQILNYASFINKYNVNMSPFIYMSIIDAIPREWRQLIKTCNFPPYIIHNNELPHLKINDQYKNINQIKLVGQSVDSSWRPRPRVYEAKGILFCDLLSKSVGRRS